MAKDIVAAALGFLTVPAVVGVIVTLVYVGKFIGSLGLSSSHYWVGFWSMIGVAVIVVCCAGLFFAVTEFRNI
jgi:hypothetical protein